METYNSSKTYKRGAKVLYYGHEYTAKTEVKSYYAPGGYGNPHWQKNEGFSYSSSSSSSSSSDDLSSDIGGAIIGAAIGSFFGGDSDDSSFGGGGGLFGGGGADGSD